MSNNEIMMTRSFSGNFNRVTLFLPAARLTLVATATATRVFFAGGAFVDDSSYGFIDVLDPGF